jgi:hypothetical protein
MKAIKAASLFLILSLVFMVPSSIANLYEWDYSNYLYSLKIVSYDCPVIAGQLNRITVEIGANTAVVLHVEFKGAFSWGHWTFGSYEVQVDEGLNTVVCEMNIPHKVSVESSSSFYFYAYVTMPGDTWSSTSWGLVQTVALKPPSEVSYEELMVCLSQLKWLIDKSSLTDGIRNSLILKLEVAGDKIDSSYQSGDNNGLLGATGSLNALINELQSNNEAASHYNSETWKEKTGYIIQRIKNLYC